jgi:phosphotriesterase-related protein
MRVLNRRQFLCAFPGAAVAATPARSILVHEHVLVDFIGADRIAPGRYDPDEVFQIAKPKLDEIYRLGCRRLHECTPNFLGRDPRLLRRLSGATGIDLWTNTGLYAAADYKYLPAFARTESAEQLARRWITEARRGVDGVKPRFIKIGVNRGPLAELDRKVVRAAALCSRETGLTIASHTGNGIAALEQIDIVAAEKVNPAKFVWVHAQSEKDHAFHEKAARAGAWVEFDGIRPQSAQWHLDSVRHMAARNLLGRTLISQDAGWYHVGEPSGGDYRGYAYLYTDFCPQLDTAWLPLLLWDNPRQAFGR